MSKLLTTVPANLQFRKPSVVSEARGQVTNLTLDQSQSILTLDVIADVTAIFIFFDRRRFLN